MFKIYNYKNKGFFSLDSTQLRNFIISSTCGKYENLSVTPERTGKRPSFLRPFLKKLSNGILIEGLFFVTAISRVNPDKKTRYMLVSIGNRADYEILLPHIEEYTSFIHIDCSDYSPIHEGGYLSSWFRENMGKAFSFIDIDYLFLKNNHLYLIEEKTYLGILGYGQKMSYQELMMDIFCETPTLILAHSSRDKYRFKISHGDFEDKCQKGSLPIEDFIDWLDR